MNAIKLLEEQHDEVADLFEQAEGTESPDKKLALFEQIADLLVIHTTLEERLFYPMVNSEETAELLLEAVQEHLGVKRIIADMLDLEASDPTFSAKLTVMRELVEHHVKEERTDMFPKVRKLLDADQLEALGDEMVALMVDFEGTAPRNNVLAETEQAAELQ